MQATQQKLVASDNTGNDLPASTVAQLVVGRGGEEGVEDSVPPRCFFSGIDADTDSDLGKRARTLLSEIVGTTSPHNNEYSHVTRSTAEVGALEPAPAPAPAPPAPAPTPAPAPALVAVAHAAIASAKNHHNRWLRCRCNPIAALVFIAVDERRGALLGRTHTSRRKPQEAHHRHSRANTHHTKPVQG